MTAKPPPVPAANRSPKGTGDANVPATDQTEHDRHLDPHQPTDPEKQGQAGNTKINTTHQGHQQDR